jgi:hypothetical protein
MSIASGFRAKWSAIMEAFDATAGQADDHRFTLAHQAASEAGVKVITAKEWDALMRVARGATWTRMDDAPTDGTPVLLTDGENVWIGSQRTGRNAGPSRGGQPTSGHMFAYKYDRPPIGWQRVPKPPQR